MKTVTLGLGLALSACGLTSGDLVDSKCLNATGEDGVASFCGNAVGTHELGIDLGTSTEISVGAASSTAGLEFASVAASDSFVQTTKTVSNGFTLVPFQLGETEVTIYDDAGAEIDRVGVNVSSCDDNLGELGAAAFCGDFDGNHVLALPASTIARIRVFTPAFGRLDIASAGTSDWSTLSVSIPTTGPTGTCDPDYDYCTNIVEVVGLQLGTADLGINDANGHLIDQVTVHVIDHW